MWKQSGFTIGLVFGIIIGLAGAAGFRGELNPQWAINVISFGLGSIATLVLWRILRPKADSTT